MLNARRYNDTATFYTEVTTTDAYGRPVVTYVLQGDFPCEVIVLEGGRALYYQSVGLQYPVQIKVRELSFTPSKVVYLGKEIILKSATPTGQDRVKEMVLLGSYK